MTKIETSVAAKVLITTAKVIENLNIQAWQLDTASQVLRFAGGLLKTDADPAAPAKQVGKAVKQRDFSLMTVLVAKTIVAISTVTLGGAMAANALLRLSGSKGRLPSLKTFAVLVKIPKGVIAIYSLYHSARTDHTKVKDEVRFKSMFGKRAFKAKDEDKAQAIAKKNVSNALDIVLIVGLFTQVALESLGQKRAAEMVDTAMTGVVIVDTAYDAYNLVTDKENRETAKSWLSFSWLPSKMRSFRTDSSAG